MRNDMFELRPARVLLIRLKQVFIMFGPETC